LLRANRGGEKILAQGFLSAAVEPLIGPTSPLTRSVRFHCLFFAPISQVTIKKILIAAAEQGEERRKEGVLVTV
jgi:hypothetical protein